MPRLSAIQAAWAADLPTTTAGRLRWMAAGCLVLLLPLSTSWPLGSSPAPNVHSIYVTPALQIQDPFLVILLIGCLFGGGRWNVSPAGIGLGGLILLGAISVPGALDRTVAIHTVVRWGVALGALLLFLRARLPGWFLGSILLFSLAIQSVIAFLQTWHGGPLGLPLEQALLSPRVGAPVLHLNDGRVFYRGCGLTFNPNVLGGMLAATIVWTLPLTRRIPQRLCWWLLWIGLACTTSRSAVLSLGATLPPVIAWISLRHPSTRRTLAVALLGAALITAGVILAGREVVRTRLQPRKGIPGGLSMIERLEYGKVALGAIAARPLTGVGAGNFPLAVARTDAPVGPNHAHNVILQLAAEVGVVGGALAVWVWLWPLVHARRSRQGDPLRVAALGAWGGVGLIALVDAYALTLTAGRLLCVLLLSQLVRPDDEPEKGL